MTARNDGADRMHRVDRIVGTARAALAMSLFALAIACGGSGSDRAGISGSGSTPAPSGSNVATAVVDSGPNNDSVNTLFVSVTICAPGSTSNCQTIDHIEVDTGSYGLRILSSALTVALPVQSVSGGASLVECASFVQGYSWGPVALANVQIGGETAGSLPVQIVGDSNFTVPDECSGSGTAVDTVAQFGANGILGVGPFVEDCGSGCAGQATGLYYACDGTNACTPTAVPLSEQVQNPVGSFAKDNNGVIVQLPSVPAGGAATVSGYLIFGIDTESNNASGSESVLTVDDSAYLTVTFGGMPLAQSFIDSGTNGIFFNDSNLPVCTQSGLADFYCPSATMGFNATLTGANGVTAGVQFSVANTLNLLSGTNFTAFSDLGGTYPGSTATFDFGLPFFYGRRVATAIEGSTTAVGTGPYFAF